MIIDVIIFIVVSALIVLVALNIKKLNKKNDVSNTSETKKQENINDRIRRAVDNYSKEVGKYKIGAKSYEYDFIDNEHPLNGLSPDFTQNYPSTLNKSNKMIVEPDLSIKYINLLNTPNNSLKNYNYKS